MVRDDSGEMKDEPQSAAPNAARRRRSRRLDDLRAQLGERARRGALTGERADTVAALGEQLDEMAAEETGRAGDERCHRQVIGTWRSSFGSIRSRISVRLSPVAVMPWLRSPTTACAGSGAAATSAATLDASSSVPQG